MQIYLHAHVCIFFFISPLCNLEVDQWRRYRCNQKQTDISWAVSDVDVFDIFCIFFFFLFSYESNAQGRKVSFLLKYMQVQAFFSWDDSPSPGLQLTFSGFSEHEG